LKSIEILGTKSTIEEAFFRALPHTLLYVPWFATISEAYMFLWIRELNLLGVTFEEDLLELLPSSLQSLSVCGIGSKRTFRQFPRSLHTLNLHYVTLSRG
jgi:hypothetical protein